MHTTDSASLLIYLMAATSWSGRRDFKAMGTNFNASVGQKCMRCKVAGPRGACLANQLQTKLQLSHS